MTHAHTGPLCPLLANLASIGTICYAKVRVVRAGPSTGSCGARLGGGIGGEEEGEEGGSWKIRKRGSRSLVEDREESV